MLFVITALFANKLLRLLYTCTIPLLCLLLAKLCINEHILLLQYVNIITCGDDLVDRKAVSPCYNFVYCVAMLRQDRNRHN